MAAALINPQMLTWAREQNRLSVEDFAALARRTVEDILAWESGQKQPAFGIAQALAKRLRVPFGYFYLSSPPAEFDFPDFRAPDATRDNQLSRDAIDVINSARRKVDWYRDYLRELGHNKLPFVGSFSVDRDPEDCANDIRMRLNLPQAGPSHSVAPTWSDYFRLFSRHAQDHGIMVFRSKDAGLSHYRSLDPDEFAGFSIADPIAPAVFVNGNDFIARQIFTLAHEVAHVWLGHTGISDVEVTAEAAALDAAERYCNRVAAAVLMPPSRFEQIWRAEGSAGRSVVLSAKRFRVSEAAALIRAREMGLVSREEYDRTADVVSDRQDLERRPRPAGNFGIPFETKGPARNSRLLFEAVTASTINGRTSLRAAAGLLDVKTGTLSKHLDQVAAAG